VADEEPPSATIHRLPIDPWSVAGLHSLDSLPEPAPVATWNTGFLEWNGRVALAPGTLSIATGLPGSGKTHVWAQIWKYVVERYGLVALIASFECSPKPHYRRYLREMHARRPEREMQPAELEAADQFIREHYRFLRHPDETPTLGWIMELAEVAVTRHKVKIIQIDPWNRLESQREPKETEPDYVAHCLRALAVFAKDMNCHVQMIAHPAKRDARRRDQPPELEDVSGAMHWWNMPDQGFVVHRKELWTPTGGRCFDAQFFHRKARFEELGYPCALPLRFNVGSRVFETVIHSDGNG
jgi:twinkle protein